MDENWRNLLRWAQISLDDCDKTLALASVWKLLNKMDLETKLQEISDGSLSPFDMGEPWGKQILREGFESLSKLPFPYYRPDFIAYEYRKGSGTKDSLPKGMRSLLSAGWTLEEVARKNGDIWFRDQDFSLQGEPWFEKLRKNTPAPVPASALPTGSRIRGLKATSSADNVLMRMLRDIDKKSPLSPSEDAYLSAVHSEIPDKGAVLQASKAALASSSRNSDFWVLWRDSNRMPVSGETLDLHLRFCPPKDLGNNELGRLKGTGLLSPLGKMLFTYDEIFMPAEKWLTFFRFKVADRVPEFVQVFPSMTGKQFESALSPRNPEKRIRVDRLPRPAGRSLNEFLFLPYISAMTDRSRLRDLYPFFESEKLYYWGEGCRKPSKTTSRLLSAVRSETGGSPDRTLPNGFYSGELQARLESESSFGNTDLNSPDPDELPPEEFNRMRHSLRERVRYSRKKGLLK